MPDASKPPRVTTLQPVVRPRPAANVVEKVVCERRNEAGVYWMHADWRGSACGFKIDCYGW